MLTSGSSFHRGAVLWVTLNRRDCMGAGFSLTLFPSWRSLTPIGRHHGMNSKLRLVGRTGAVLAFCFCLLGGSWILRACWLESSKDNALYIGMGFYFVGKAFFVGPMLWMVTEQACGR